MPLRLHFSLGVLTALLLPPFSFTLPVFSDLRIRVRIYLHAHKRHDSASSALQFSEREGRKQKENTETVHRPFHINIQDWSRVFTLPASFIFIFFFSEGILYCNSLKNIRKYFVFLFLEAYMVSQYYLEEFT